MKLKSIICIAIKCCRNLALPCKLSDHANENRWICIFVLSLFFLTVFLFQEFGCRVPTEIWQLIVLVSNKRMLLWWAINWVSLCKTWLPMGETNIISESEKSRKTDHLAHANGKPSGARCYESARNEMECIHSRRSSQQEGAMSMQVSRSRKQHHTHTRYDGLCMDNQCVLECKKWRAKEKIEQITSLLRRLHQSSVL